jgi:hypothetical protein
MSSLNGAADAGFFPSLAFRGLAMRKREFGITLGKGPLVAAVGFHQQEFD